MNVVEHDLDSEFDIQVLLHQREKVAGPLDLVV